MPQDKLRKLSTQLPGPDEVANILLHLQKESDRTAAIVGASILESLLERMLTKSLKSEAADLPHRLFENRGPLSDFSSKINIAQAFAIIPDRVADDLHRIRKIRNCFAHARVEVSFETPAIAHEVSELAAVMAARSTEASYPSDYIFPYRDHKTSYGLSCYIMLVALKADRYS